MGYEYYGRGASPYIAMAQGMGIYTIFLIIMAIVALVLSFVIFHKFVGKPEGNQLKQTTGKTGFLERFLRFKQLIVGDVLRWAYIFCALLVALEGIVTSIFLITLIGLSFAFFFMALFNILLVALIEIGLRVAYEMRMLMVLIEKDTHGIHKILTKQYGPAGPQPQEPEQTQPQQPQVGYQQPMGWTCPTCGCADNHGAFCKQCGAPKA